MNSTRPAVKPTIAEIQASPDRGKGGYTKIVSIRDLFFVKYGAYLSELEAENLLFVERNLNISAPKLYAAWREPADDGTLYIVSEFLPGDNLTKLWPCLEEEEKGAVSLQLQRMLEKNASTSCTKLIRDHHTRPRNSRFIPS
ncbi:hypothetical protein AA313_de0201112 [Arthrobotrys entomopaga]|nr:hypothetical protein AA313_de0201112 [Arthrobotrys entomopaga]